MSRFESIDDSLYVAAPEDIVRRRKNPALSLLIGVAGSALAVWSLTAPALAERDNLSSMLMLAGGIVALVGFIKAGLSFSATAPVYKPTGEKIHRRELFYAAASKQTLCAAMEASDIAKLAGIPRSNTSSGILMTVYATDSGSFTIAQVSEYIPHAYEPVTAVVKFTGEQAKAVVALV